MLGRKQSKHGEILAWLEEEIKNSRASDGKGSLRLAQAVKQGEAVLGNYKY